MHAFGRSGISLPRYCRRPTSGRSDKQRGTEFACDMPCTHRSTRGRDRNTYRSRNWLHYEASVASVTLDTVASVAQTMASQGYVLTAFGAGGNPTFGWLLVGTRLQGSTAPRPIFVSTYYRPSDDLYYSKGYVDVVTIYDNPTPSPSTTTRIWIVEQ